MTHRLTPFRSLAALALVAGIGCTGIAVAQSATQSVAETAEQIAREATEAEDAIRAIDPTTGGQSPVVNPSSTAPYATPESVGASPEPFEPGLPPLAEDELGSAPPLTAPLAQTPLSQASPQVQTLPAPQPTTRVPAASRELVSNDPFVIKSILPVGGTIRYGEWFWDESNAPKSGKLVITVDLDARVISVFRDGHEIGTAVALLGTRKHPTPLGSFPILTKEKDNVSEKYDNAPMPWTLRLTWDGIAIHGSPVINGYASHGCIGVPDPFAEKLFEVAKKGDRVIITRGKMIGVGDKITS
jgi:lipoprotein-anchoring transpeptidase ErfK/SrfK